MSDDLSNEGYGSFLQSLVTLAESGGLTESGLRELIDSFTQTVYFNYQKINSVGHPHPNPWPHGVATVEWVRQTSLQNKLVSIAVGGSDLSLSQVSPWQGAACIDINNTSSVSLPRSPRLGDIVDVLVGQGGPCGIIDAGDGGAIGEGGSVDYVGANQIVRFVCLNPTGPLWSANNISRDQWITACNSVAVQDALANLLSKVYLNYQPVNALGDPKPEWPHGAVNAGHANAHFLHSRDVIHVLDGTELDLTQSAWQAAIVRSRAGGWPNTVLPSNPNLNDVVLWKVNQGADNSKVTPPAGGDLGAGVNQFYNEAGPYMIKFVFTNATPGSTVWSLTQLSEEQFQDELAAHAIDLALAINPALSRTSLGLGTAATHAATDFAQVSGFTRIAPTGAPGALGPLNATDSPVIVMDSSGSDAGTLSHTLADGAYDGQEIELLAGPWNIACTWEVTPDHQMFPSGTKLAFTGLAGCVVLKWWYFGSSWTIKSLTGAVTLA